MSQFHVKHGRSISVSSGNFVVLSFKNIIFFDGKTARKYWRIGSNWAYSRRDVKPNEVICFRITKLSSKFSKQPFVVSFTDEDPQKMPTRPKTSWHVCNGKMSLAPAECRKDALIMLMYEVEKRLVFIGVDGQLRAVSSLYGLTKDLRWLAVRIDGNVTEVQMHECLDKQWDTFVLDATRVSKIFESLRVVNRGAPGLPKPQLIFQAKSDPRVSFSQDARIATIQGSMAQGVNLYVNRQILLGEIVSIKFSRVCFGTTVEIFAISGDSNHDEAKGHDQPLIIQLTHDETVRVVTNETGMIVQGVRKFVQSSARFYPITPLWLRILVRSPATHITAEFEDPHKLPPRNSMIGEELVAKNRAFSSTDREHSLLCKICFTRKMDTALQPCHHVSMCQDCTKNVMDRVGWKCPICGENVTGVFSINVI